MKDSTLKIYNDGQVYTLALHAWLALVLMRIKCCPFKLIEDQVFSSEPGGLSCFSGLLELGPPVAWLVQFLKRYNENWGVPYNVKLII